MEEMHRLLAGVVDELGSHLEALAADIFRSPELANEEVNTVARIAGELEEEGFQVTTGVGGLPTAFRAEKGRGGPAIGFLAEYDAIPGLGHACGHHLLVGSAVGAALALGRTLAPRPGRIVVIGAPAEETIGGKVVLTERQAFADLDAALLAHPADTDRVVVESLASWSVEVVFEGRAAHAAAAPEQGINALDAVIQLFLAKDALLKGLGPGVRIPGVILEGGRRANLIPDRARARFSLRAPNAAYLLDPVLVRFREMVDGIALATRTRATVTPIDNLYDELISNPVLASRYELHARAAGLDPRPGSGYPLGSLDIGQLSHRIPVLHPLFRVLENPAAIHTPAFAEAGLTPFALAAMRRAALALARTAADLFLDPTLLEQAQAAYPRQVVDLRALQGIPLITEQPES